MTLLEFDQFLGYATCMSVWFENRSIKKNSKSFTATS